MRRGISIVVFLSLLTAVGCPAEDDSLPPGDDDTSEAGDDDDSSCGYDTVTDGCEFTVPGSCPTIQRAIDAAVDGETVCVAPGTYREILEISGKDVGVLGVAGSEETILDAESAGTVVQFVAADGPAASLQGFTLRNGDARFGGGLFVEQATPILADLQVVDNHGYEFGGGLYATGGAPSLTDVTFSGNHADDAGGGVYLSESSPTLTDVVIRENSGDDCGALRAVHSAPVLTRVEISDNRTDDRGTVCWEDSPATLTDVLVSANQAYEGAGMKVDGSVGLTMNGVAIVDNAATEYGGGLFLDDTSLVLTNLRVERNTAEFGGGIYVYRVHAAPGVTLGNVRLIDNAATRLGGGLFVSQSSSTRLENAVLSGNEADEGGGFYLEGDASLIVVNSVLCANSASSLGGAGRLYMDATFGGTNTILWANQADIGGGLYGPGATADLSHCVAWDNVPENFFALDDPTGTDGNLSVDPGFLDTTAAWHAGWDLHLTVDSPLVDVGSGNVIDPDGTVSDIGAYGGPGASTWDLDSDGYPEWWVPGDYDGASYPGEGWDCEDQDPGVYPGQGC